MVALAIALTILVILAILIFVEVKLLTQKLNIYSEILKNFVNPPVPKLSESDLKDFKEADAQATQQFNDVLANLNAFMTGQEVRNVEQQ